MSEQKYVGKYRGSVFDNVDPMQMGRLMLMVPDVLGDIPSSWALPCLPVAGMQMGTWFVPPIGAGVWVEFEQGDADYPVWTGGWWSVGQPPALAVAAPPAVSNFVVQTQLQNTLVISDAPGPTGGILLKSMTGAMIMINETGITISNGQGATIVLAGPTVTVNEGALVVT